MFIRQGNKDTFFKYSSQIFPIKSCFGEYRLTRGSFAENEVQGKEESTILKKKVQSDEITTKD